MASWLTTTRQATHLIRLSSPKLGVTPPTSLFHRRGFSSGGEHHGPQKVNFWQDPLSPSRWKEEHFVIVSLAGWGALMYGGYKYFTKGKKDKEDEKVAESPK